MPSIKGTVVTLAVILPTTLGLYKNGSMMAPCDSEIYCHGEILKQIQLAKPFTDSKTFVDMPAKKSAAEIKATFDKLPKPLSNSSALQDFLTENFDDAGGELQPVPKDQLKADPQFLEKIKDTDIKEFVLKVIDIWPELTRKYVGSNSTCEGCPNSFIPINRTFVVAGGRFREPYYWDSYWIIEGLLRSGGSYIKIAKNMVENFLDLIWLHGFVPNGTRLYYLNRSQPPLLAQMVKLYIDHTRDESLLRRAVPLLVKEHEFWIKHRSITTKKKKLPVITQRYAVENTEPRPESYREDYETATNKSYYSESGEIYNATEQLDATSLATLYANLASGAESGLDYSVSKWAAEPTHAMRDDFFPLRSLNTGEIIPVDLNAILYANEVVIADLFHRIGRDEECEYWRSKAFERSYDINTMFWNSKHKRFFDHNITSGQQNIFIPEDKDTQEWEREGAPIGQQVYFSVTQYYPFWLKAAPKNVLKSKSVLANFMKPVQAYLSQTVGGIPSSNLKTGQQWDQPNVWPPHMHILMQTLVQLPVPPKPKPRPKWTKPKTWEEKALRFLQSLNHIFDPLPNGDYEVWSELQDLALQLGQRYLDSTFCTWYATGGSTSKTPQLPGFTDKDKGIMFEKYDDNSTNHTGGGGEYEVVEGFGWTNGVLIWVVDTFGDKLKRPDCGNITAAKTHSEKRRLSALHLSKIDAQRIKKF